MNEIISITLTHPFSFTMTMEAKAIQKFFPKLVSAVGTCVQNVSDHCFSESLIEETTQRKVLESAGTDADKARVLMAAVRDSVARNPTYFNVFVSVLEKVLPGVDDSLLKAIKAAVASNINEVEELEIPSPTQSQTVCESSDSTAAPRSETSQGDSSEFIHKGHTHALKGAKELDSMTSAVSEDMTSNNMYSSELSDSQVALTMVTSTDAHEDIPILNQSHTLCVQAKEAIQGALLCEMDTQRHNSNDSNESSVVEVQDDYQVKSNQDFKDLQCTSASQSTKGTQTSSDSTSINNSRDRAVEDLKHVMRVDLKHIRKKFVKLQSDVRVSLREVPLDDIIPHVLGYAEVFDPESDKKVPLLPKEKLQEAASTDQLFNKVLQKQWNFLEFDLLESIVEQCCAHDEAICKQIKEYHKDLKEFFEKRRLSEISEDLSLSNCTDETQEVVTMKLDLNDPTLKEIIDLKSKICEILEIMPSTLLISEIRPGCVEITFLITVHISEYVFAKPITDSQREALKAASVLKFTWRNRTEIVAEEEFVDNQLEHHDDTSSAYLGSMPTLKEVDYEKEDEQLENKGYHESSDQVKEVHGVQGQGPYSDVSHPIHTKTAVPGKPGKPRAAEITVNSINLEWNKPQYNAHITKAYRILYRHVNEPPEHWKEEQTNGIQQIFKICGLAAKSEYIFKICAVSEDGCGPESDESDLIRTHPLLPGKPGRPIATEVTSNSIHIEWIKPQSNSQLVTQYTIIIYRSSFDPPDALKEIKTCGREEHATVCSLRSKSVYFIKIRPESADGPGTESEYSEPIHTKPMMPGKPGKPRALLVTSNSIQIEWKMPESNAELTEYFTIVYRSIQSHQDEWKEENTREANDNVVLGSLLPNQEYVFKVCPISEIGPGPESDLSDPIRTKPLTPGRPGKPTPMSITSDAIHLEWSQPYFNAHIITSYTISYCSPSNTSSEWKYIISEKNAVVLHNLSPNSTYICKVRPESDGGPGIISDTSDPIQTKPLLPGNPGISVSTAAATDTTISLEWEKPNIHPELVTSYTVLYQTVGDKWKEQQTNSSKELTMTLKDLKAKTEYKLKVRPESKQGHGTESNEIRVKTKPHVPGKPSGTISVLKTRHNYLWLSWKPPLRFPELVITYTVFYSTDEQYWLSTKTNSAEPKVEILGLAPETKYFIKIQAEGADGSGPESDLSEASTKMTLAECMRKESQLLMARKGQNPKIYLLPTKQVIISGKNKIAKCSIKKIKNSKNDRGEKVLMIVGGTGAGKTTLINGFVNYIFGVQWQDNFRFKLTAEEEDGKKGQAHSQTKWITAYNIQAMEDSSIPYTVTIIDTPGFGDTDGIERDKQLVTQIREFFLVRDGIDQIHAIGFVVQASIARLTPTQKYIFDSILSLFGKDIGNIIFMMTTFADAMEPPVLESIAANDIQYNGYFKFNNSALFTSASASTKGFDRLFWELDMASCRTFFDKLDEVEPQSLTLTKAVLEERRRLETIVNGLQPQITAGLNKLEEIHAEEKILRDRESEILRNKDFEYEITVTKQKKIILESGKYVTNCLECIYTCHYPCTYSNDKEKFKCTAMDGGGFIDGKCRVCPGKCHWTKHFNNTYRFELYQEVEHRTSADLKLRYDQAKEGKTHVENAIDDLHKDLKDMEALVLMKVRDAHECLNRLDEIALKPDPLNEVEYIDVLIESEKKQSYPGFSERIKALKELKSKSQILKDLKKPSVTFEKWWHKLRH